MTRLTKLSTGLVLLLICMSTPAFPQIKFKLQWLPDSLAWGVFAKPEAGTVLSENTLIGSGQVTIVAPAGYPFIDLRNFSGAWLQNAYVPSPAENPGRDYVSFGYVSADPPLRLFEGKETLLFTFKKKARPGPDKLYLIEANDPFNVVPNSANANPGNDLTVMDIERRVMYYYTGNYAPAAWDNRPGKTVPQGAYVQGASSGSKKDVIRP